MFNAVVFNGMCVAGRLGKLFTVSAMHRAANKFEPFRGCSSRRRRDGRLRIWFANFVGHGLQKRCTVMHCEKYLSVCVRVCIAHVSSDGDMRFYCRRSDALLCLQPLGRSANYHPRSAVSAIVKRIHKSVVALA